MSRQLKAAIAAGSVVVENHGVGDITIFTPGAAPISVRGLSRGKPGIAPVLGEGSTWTRAQVEASNLVDDHLSRGRDVRLRSPGRAAVRAARRPGRFRPHKAQDAPPAPSASTAPAKKRRPRKKEQSKAKAE